MSVMCGRCVGTRAFWITGQLGEYWNLGYKAAAHGFDEQRNKPLRCPELFLTRSLSGVPEIQN